MVCGVSRPLTLQFVRLLKFLDRVGQRLVVDVVVAGQPEPLAQLRNAIVLCADPGRRSIGNRGLARCHLAAAQLRQLSLERNVVRRLRLVAGEQGSDVLGLGDRAEHVGRRRRLQLIENVAADTRPMHASDRGVMRVGDDRRGEPHLGIGERRRIGRGREVRHRIVGRIEAVGVDLAEISHGFLGAGVDLAVGDPERRVVARGIERLERRAILLAADEAVELAVTEFAQLIGDRRVGVGDRARRRRGGLIAASWRAASSPPVLRRRRSR